MKKKVKELCTSTDLKMAQAILTALEKKMESVDELLESLQFNKEGLLITMMANHLLFWDECFVNAVNINQTVFAFG